MLHIKEEHSANIDIYRLKSRNFDLVNDSGTCLRKFLFFFLKESDLLGSCMFFNHFLKTILVLSALF